MTHEWIISTLKVIVGGVGCLVIIYVLLPTAAYYISRSVTLGYLSAYRDLFNNDRGKHNNKEA